jgi:queuine tRNA-ribosyltransferase
MNWNGPILTDSGGFQVFSLAKLRKISEEGALFQNHLDGAPCFLSPETSMEIQATLGSDIAMVFDECPPAGCGFDYAAKSLDLTLRWARRSREAWEVESEKRGRTGEKRHLLFGIVQGSTFEELRRKSAEALTEIGFDGYAVGGISVGEAEAQMLEAVDFSTPHLPDDKPRYAMGLGTPPQMLEMIARGIDMFDCVLPTRLARNGTAFTTTGTIHLKNQPFARDTGPIEEGCGCYACREFTRGYIRHLVKAQEILGLQLISLHNLHFYLDLMRRTREAIEAGTFDAFRAGFVANYRPHDPGGEE